MMAEARRILEKYHIADWESLKGTEDWPAWLDARSDGMELPSPKLLSYDTLWTRMNEMGR